MEGRHDRGLEVSAVLASRTTRYPAQLFPATDNIS